LALHEKEYHRPEASLNLFVHIQDKHVLPAYNQMLSDAVAGFLKLKLSVISYALYLKRTYAVIQQNLFE
jgi:hypothetical protein